VSAEEQGSETGPGGTMPAIRFAAGNPTAEEAAAVVAVLAAASGGGDGRAAPRPSLWKAASRAPGQRLSPGPGAWRASGLPR
jgi:hypothetical protein